MAYEVAQPLSAAEWLALSEDERIALVRETHERSKSPVGQSPEAHAAIHVVVENRLATADEPVVRAYDRLRAAGLDRHVAVHALASVVAQHMMGMLDPGATFDQTVADRDFEALDPNAFKRKA